MKQFFVLLALGACISLQSKSQDNPTTSDASAGGMGEISRNIIKVNLTSIALKTYSLQYERVLNKTISVTASFRTMPTTSLPFKSAVLNALDDNEETKEAIESLRLSNFAVTPEVRFYLGRKGYGRGFYIAPFYRYAKFKAKNFSVTYENGLGAENKIDLSGQLTTNTAGFMLGAQWFIGQHISLDWWIFGPHYGSANGDFNGASKQPLTQDEQDNLRSELEDLDIPFTDKTVFVNQKGASLKLDGPWGGIRAGLSIGIRF